jgi:hypothetical protein
MGSTPNEYVESPSARPCPEYTRATLYQLRNFPAVRAHSALRHQCFHARFCASEVSIPLFLASARGYFFPRPSQHFSFCSVSPFTTNPRCFVPSAPFLALHLPRVSTPLLLQSFYSNPALRSFSPAMPPLGYFSRYCELVRLITKHHPSSIRSSLTFCAACPNPHSLRDRRLRRVEARNGSIPARECRSLL